MAKGLTVLTVQRTQCWKRWKPLLVWLNEKQLAGDSDTEAMIYERARKLNSDLLQGNPFLGAVKDGFESRNGWLDKFHKRSVIKQNLYHTGIKGITGAEAHEGYIDPFAVHEF